VLVSTGVGLLVLGGVETSSTPTGGDLRPPSASNHFETGCRTYPPRRFAAVDSARLRCYDAAYK
jgi:hypothetical protein